MNDDQLLERLERATAPGKKTPANLDAETAELRDTLHRFYRMGQAEKIQFARVA